MADESMKAACLRGVEHADGQFSADSPSLPVVAHRERHFHVLLVDGAEAAESDDLVTVASLVFRDEREVPPVIHRRETANENVRQRAKRRQKPQMPTARTEVREQLSNGFFLEPPQGSHVDPPIVGENEEVVQIRWVWSFSHDSHAD